MSSTPSGSGGSASDGVRGRRRAGGRAAVVARRRPATRARARARRSSGRAGPRARGCARRRRDRSAGRRATRRVRRERPAPASPRARTRRRRLAPCGERAAPARLCASTRGIRRCARRGCAWRHPARCARLLARRHAASPRAASRRAGAARSRSRAAPRASCTPARSPSSSRACCPSATHRKRRYLRKVGGASTSCATQPSAVERLGERVRDGHGDAPGELDDGREREHAVADDVEGARHVAQQRQVQRGDRVDLVEELHERIEAHHRGHDLAREVARERVAAPSGPRIGAVRRMVTTAPGDRCASLRACSSASILSAKNGSRVGARSGCFSVRKFGFDGCAP